jgi:hypothetical protein
MNYPSTKEDFDSWKTWGELNSEVKMEIEE